MSDPTTARFAGLASFGATALEPHYLLQKRMVNQLSHIRPT